MLNDIKAFYENICKQRSKDFKNPIHQIFDFEMGGPRNWHYLYRLYASTEDFLEEENGSQQ